MSELHIALARSRKTARLVLAIDDLAARLECKPAALIPAIERWSDAEWSALSVQAGQKPASEITRALVLDALRARAS